MAKAEKRFEMRLPMEEFEEWRKNATASGQSLAAWIRERCGKEEKMKDVKQERGVQVVEESFLPSKPGKCPHGKMKGELCYKCDSRFGLPAIKY